MSKGKNGAIFAADEHGGLYVQLEAVMHPMCAMYDGLSLVRFGNEKTYYLKVDDAIEWCRKEGRGSEKAKYDGMIAVLEKFKRQEQADPVLGGGCK